MIIVKISRDEARLIQTACFRYMIMLAVSKVQQADIRSSDFLTGKILLSLIQQVQFKFQKKLQSEAKQLKHKLSDAEGIAFYSFLMNFPIKEKQVYMHLLRQRICDTIYKQILEPVVAEDDEELIEDDL